MLHKKSGFTLAEALIALLIMSLIIAATIPVITKKHREVAEHGRWECTLNADGKHVVRTVIAGIPSDYENVGASCSFNPPPKAENFFVKVVGGGGSGGGGNAGNSNNFINTKDPNTPISKVIETTGNYSVYLLGGGGGGGGMGCRKPQNFRPESSVTSFATYGNNTASDPGGYDYAVPASVFDYTKLYSNNGEYKQYLSPENQGSHYCFAEKDWDHLDMNLCWNYPGQGGGAGITYSSTHDFSKGDLVSVSVGDGGTTTSVGGESDGVGGPGTEGEPTILNSSTYKVRGYGGGGGFARGIVYLKYNVPVMYQKYKWVIDGCSYPTCTGGYVDSYSDCTSTVKDSCPSHCNWATTSTDAETGVEAGTCTSPREWDSCAIPGTEYYDCTQPDGPAVRENRTNYFNVPACAMVGYGGGPNFGKRADIPGFASSVTVTAELPGDGGYGAGVETRVPNVDPGPDDPPFDPDNPPTEGMTGNSGVATIQYVTFAGGSGGQAGAYVYTTFKKLPKSVTINIGRGGEITNSYPIGNNFGEAEGRNGGNTEFGSLLVAAGGMGGRMKSVYRVGSNNYASGGDGAPSPLDGGVNRALIIPRGGKSGSNNSYHGQSVLTPQFNRPSGMSASSFAAFLFSTAGFQVTVGGNPLDYTYGAGGGGGAGGKKPLPFIGPPGPKGVGGSGAPGIVIVEW